ncbi:MAG: hypothetical protein IPJ95_10400 [Gemmatimonadetes bacterium]|nr:hypothetical protein [Gemmatimonadota bacterium]MBK7783076.1 hypothetical protein [Gemmatimonadota bacterium]MBK7924022.1 hypothetical protein [Gemmatimonadota bacterium]MBK9068874.1 hypothetical protein [Gemmatimonadota bacterium]MBP6668069.1 hypothetical protein [Gemmatimonadales bacterium]
MHRLLPLLALLAACRPAPAEAPDALVSRFYGAVIASRETGAPTAAALAAWRPMLSDTLRSLLEAARAHRDADAARAPDEKPAFAEGDLFSSLFEGPTSVTVTAVDSAPGAWRVTVLMRYAGATPEAEWTDTVQVIEQHGRRVIDDVAYGGTWDFASQGRLRRALASALAGGGP